MLLAVKHDLWHEYKQQVYLRHVKYKRSFSHLAYFIV
jgi:hypothetical protein